MAKREFLLIYGSQLGSGESIANEVADTASSLKFVPRLHPMNDCATDKFDLNTERIVVIITSSTGDGDPPDNAKKLHRSFHEATKHYPNGLKHLNFALLALGDSNYSTFHGFPKYVERHLLELGASPFYETGWADDATGLEEVVEPWITDLWDALEKIYENTLNLPKLEAPRKPIAAENGHNDNEELMTEQLGNMDMNSMDSPPEFVPLSCIDRCTCEWKWADPSNVPNLRQGDDAFWENNADLRVPLMPPQYVNIRVKQDQLDSSFIPWQNAAPVVGAQTSHLIPVTVTSNRSITPTEPDAVSKPKYELLVEHETDFVTYEPGDAFYFVFDNAPEEVDFILKRLAVVDDADKSLWLSPVHDQDGNASKPLPAYVPRECSYRYLLTKCLDIRRSPGRPVLRMLAEYCSDTAEKTRLLQLCSSQGVNEFTNFVRKTALSLCDLLHAFPSCKPPFERLIEQLPRLLPRPLSVASCHLEFGGFIRFVYSMVTFEPTKFGRFYARKGLCTRWLSQQKDGQKIYIIYKEPNNFRLPATDYSKVPLILIGPGTGVAPFLGFLQQIRKDMIRHDIPARSVQRWLFFGCRRLDTDFIYKSEMESFVADGVLTQLHVCESRPADEGKKKRYVQDALTTNGHFVAEAVMDPANPAHVYICGDALSMSKQVMQTFIQIITLHSDMSEDDARKYVMEMKKDGRYIEDVWT